MEAKYLSNKKLTRLHYPTGSEGLLDSELLILSKVSVSMLKSILNILVTPTKVDTLVPANETTIKRAEYITDDFVTPTTEKRYVVLSENKTNRYVVDTTRKTCSCLDHIFRNKVCKHMVGVQFFVNRKNAQ